MSDGFVVLVEFDVAAPHEAEFLRLVRANATASVATEPGCRRFDVLRPEDGKGPVTLYEIYDSRAAFEAHLGTAHFTAFEEAVRPMVRSRAVRHFDLHEHAKQR